MIAQGSSFSKAIKFHFPKYEKLFQSGFFYFLSSQRYFLKYKKVLSKEFVRGFRFRKYNKSFLLRKYNKFFRGFRFLKCIKIFSRWFFYYCLSLKKYFPKYKKFLGFHFLKYKKVPFRGFRFWKYKKFVNIRAKKFHFAKI